MSETKKKRGGIFYGWWIVLAGAGLNLLMGGTIAFSSTAFFTPLVKEFRWSYLTISLASSLRSIESGIASPIMGLLVDRIGPRKLLVTGVGIAGLGTLLLSRTNSLTLFYTASIITAIGTSAISPPVLMAAVAQWFRKNISKAMGVLAAGVGAGGILVPVVVWLIDSFHWRIALVIIAFSIWAIGIPLALAIRHKPEDYGYLPDGQMLEPDQAPIAEEAAAPDFSLRQALKTKAFWVLTLASGLLFLGVGIITLHVMPYLASVGISRPTAALVATLTPLVSVGTRLGFGWLGDIIEKRYALVLAFSLQSMGLFFFAFAPHIWPLIPFLIAFPSGWGGTVTMRGAIQRDYFGRRAYGSIQGLLMGIAILGNIVGPALAGWIYDSRGSYFVVWLGLGVLTAFAIPMLLSLKPPRHPSLA